MEGKDFAHFTFVLRNFIFKALTIDEPPSPLLFLLYEVPTFATTFAKMISDGAFRLSNVATKAPSSTRSQASDFHSSQGINAVNRREPSGIWWPESRRDSHKAHIHHLPVAAKLRCVVRVFGSKQQQQGLNLLESALLPPHRQSLCAQWW